jgi:hypothetical protein
LKRRYRKNIVTPPSIRKVYALSTDYSTFFFYGIFGKINTYTIVFFYGIFQKLHFTVYRLFQLRKILLSSFVATPETTMEKALAVIVFYSGEILLPSSMVSSSRQRTVCRLDGASGPEREAE